MPAFAWLAMRQAREALEHGRLDEALRLINQPHAQDRRGSAALVGKLARAFVERGERSLRKEDADAAWRDLLHAEHLQSHETRAGRLRDALTRLGAAEVRALLQAGEPSRAEEAASRLRGKLVRSPELQVLEESAHAWLSARDLAGRGDFAHALAAADRIRRLMPNLGALEEYRGELETRQRTFASLLVRMHDATGANAITAAEAVLAVAPHHAEAKRVRGQAWRAVEPVTIALSRPEAETSPTPTSSPDRFLLWIDGVGGYLVCLGSRVHFGQAVPGSSVDVPMVADVSRLHAALSRDGEGYVLEAVRALQVNGQPVTRALLRPGDRVTLGASCQFQFRQPVPTSATARLDLVSGHRLPLGVDGILVMADSLVLGSDDQVHVTIPDLKNPVIFFRHKDGLGLRHTGGLTVNGRKVPERTILGPRALVEGDDFAFTVEPVETSRDRKGAVEPSPLPYGRGS